jgi:dihydrofolate reductase
MSNIRIIVACDLNGGIGKDGLIPWVENGINKYPNDFKKFSEITKNSICIMGRKTYQEIYNLRTQKNPTATELLPNRQSFVITSSKQDLPLVNKSISIREVVEFNNPDNKDVFIIGGEMLFVEAISFSRQVFLTAIPEYYDCNRFFPINYMLKHFSLFTHEKGPNGEVYFSYLRGGK